MNISHPAVVALTLMTLTPAELQATIFHETDDPDHNTTNPGDNLGWQYEGTFVDFLGVPIDPLHFITAKHIGGAVGSSNLVFHGETYVTVGYTDILATDMRVWAVSPEKPFKAYAPLSNGFWDVGSTATIIGRGTRRGEEVIAGNELKGWKWGTPDKVQRWGRNVIARATTRGSLGQFLDCDFNKPGLPDECHLSDGDSGGGMFILENGLCRLAGINYHVEGQFSLPSPTTYFEAALFDKGGMKTSSQTFSEAGSDNPSSLWCSRVAAYWGPIQAVAPGAGEPAAENYQAWQTLYFTPAQIADPEISGPLGDADGDGIVNLLEFSLNLDPSFPGRPEMIPATGLRGLPVAQLVGAGGEQKASFEFVRRKASSGAGITAVPRFSSDLGEWHAAEVESVTSLNPRWERVVATESIPGGPGPHFARLEVSFAE